MLKDYTIDEMEIEILSRTTDRSSISESISEALDDISIQQFKSQLTVQREDDKDYIYAGPTKVVLQIQGNKVVPNIAGIQLKGIKRTAVLQLIMHHSKILLNSQGYGNESPMYSDEQTVFDTYTVEWNKKRYSIGFIHKEDWEGKTKAAFTGASWMSKHRDRPDRVEADVKIYSHPITPIYNSHEYDDIHSLQERLDEAQANVDYVTGLIEEYTKGLK